MSFILMISMGGIEFGQEYVEFIEKNLMGRERVFELCAGQGFIGFSLLGSGLCKSLCLTDLNDKAIEACMATIQRNYLDEVVTLYKSDCLDQVPKSERWDLVVGNLPHFPEPIQSPMSPLLYLDQDWRMYERFYRTVGNYLAQGGAVVLQENAHTSTLETFDSMIKEAGLQVVESRRCQEKPSYFFLWSEVVADTVTLV